MMAKKKERMWCDENFMLYIIVLNTIDIKARSIVYY